MKISIINRRQKAFAFARSKDFENLRRIVANGCPVNKQIIKSVCRRENELEKLLRCARNFEGTPGLYKVLRHYYSEDMLNQKLIRWGCLSLLCQAATEKLIALQQLEALACKDEPMAAEYLGSLGRFDLLVKYPNANAVIVLHRYNRVYDLQRLGK